LKWWVDAAFAVHLNMWGHSGAYLWEEDFPSWVRPSRSSKLEALRNWKL
jgi:hypothetical protein